MVFWTCVFWLDSICLMAGIRTSRIQDFKREYCAVGLGSSPAWVSWLTGAGVRLFCQLRSSDAHSYIMSSPSVGSSSSSRFPDPLRLGHGYGSHPASWFPLHLFAASLPFPILPPRSPNNLDLGWAFILKSRFNSTAASLMAFLNCVPSQNNESQTHLFGFVHSFQNGNVQALQRWQHVEILSQVLGEIVWKKTSCWCQIQNH